MFQSHSQKVIWMNECLTTLQHDKQVDYWVQKKVNALKWFPKVNMFNVLHTQLTAMRPANNSGPIELFLVPTSAPRLV